MVSRLNQLIVAEYAELVQGREGVVLLGLERLTVQEAQALRDKVREQGVELQVTQNRLARAAFRQVNIPIPPEAFAGTCALLVGSAEATIRAARAIEELWKKAAERKVHYRAAWFDGGLMGAAEAARLHLMPDRQALRALLCGVLLEPARRLARVLAEVPVSSARALRARAEQGTGS